MSSDTADKKLRCVVIGAGVSGILIAIKLREAFKDNVDIAIFEKNHDVGGTWLENRYPGCACDVPSHIYQYSFSPNPNWSTFYAPSAEIKSYLKAVAFHHGVDKYMKFNSLVEKAVWDEATAKWTVSVQDQGDFECEILFNASGILNNFRFPTIRGIESFKGPVLHTANWDERTDLRGKRVAIIGAGASAIQTLPAIQAEVEHVDVYIRTPSWIMGQVLESMAPTHGLKYTAEERERFRNDPEYSIRIRKEMEVASNKVLKAFIRASPAQAELRERLEASMKSLVTDPALQQHLIPTFDVGCRRISPGEPYLHAVQKPNVTPVFGEVDQITPEGVVVEGQERPVDVIIAATGFDTSFRPRFPIVGQDGRNLRELWKDDPIGYCGLAVSGFPNYLTFLGPNTPIGNGGVMGTLEATADYFVRLITKMRRENASSFNVRPEVQADFDEHTQRTMQKMVWSGKCNSWYKNKEGKVIALWPGSSLHYRETLEANRWEDYEWKYKGNRFSYWGQGFSAVEDDPEGDLAYYLKSHEPLPLEAYYRSATGFAGVNRISDSFRAACLADDSSNKSSGTAENFEVLSPSPE